MPCPGYRLKDEPAHCKDNTPC